MLSNILSWSGHISAFLVLYAFTIVLHDIAAADTVLMVYIAYFQSLLAYDIESYGGSTEAGSMFSAKHFWLLSNLYK